MKHSFRAGGIAAASLALVATTALAGPSVPAHAGAAPALVLAGHVTATVAEDRRWTSSAASIPAPISGSVAGHAPAARRRRGPGTPVIRSRRTAGSVSWSGSFGRERAQRGARMPGWGGLLRSPGRADRRPAGRRRGGAQPRRLGRVSGLDLRGRDAAGAILIRPRRPLPGDRQTQRRPGARRLPSRTSRPSTWPTLLSSDVLWYHADYVSPGWGRRLDRVTQIGAHIFYVALRSQAMLRRSLRQARAVRTRWRRQPNRLHSRARITACR